jgi:hypothetical protein
MVGNLREKRRGDQPGFYRRNGKTLEPKGSEIGGPTSGLLRRGFGFKALLI